MGRGGVDGSVSADDVLLLGFGAGAALAGLVLLARGRSAVGASLAFGACMLAVAGALAVIGAHALAGALLWLEAGGTLAAFSFGVHLQNLEHPGFAPGRDRVLKLAAVVALAVGAAEGMRALLSTSAVSLAAPPAGLRALGRVLFTDALLVTELVPLLLASGAVAMLALWPQEDE
jgi:NADH:ubiquinone oxidoreductase subunit 6 (subunit J)